MLLCPEAALAEDRYAFVREYLARRPAPADGGVLFDVGAETLRMKPDVEAAGYQWFGFDLDPKSHDIARWDINTPFFGNRRADIVLLMDVIEHTYNPGIAMQNIAKVLKPDGRLVMTTPNPRWSRARTMHLYTGFLACFTQHDLDVNHHVFIPWPHIMLKLVSDCGLELEQYVTLDRDEIKPKRLSLMSPVLAIERLVRTVIEWRDPTARGLSYAFVARPKTADTNLRPLPQGQGSLRPIFAMFRIGRPGQYFAKQPSPTRYANTAALPGEMGSGRPDSTCGK